MTRSKRALLRALCALALTGGLLAPTTARAQIAYEQVAGAEARGGHLVGSVTEADPSNGGRVVLDGVGAFDRAGGVAVFEPAAPGREVFEYEGVDVETSSLTGVVRTVPGAHPDGSFVQALEDTSPSPEPSESPSTDPKPGDRPTSQPPDPQDDDDPVSDPVEPPSGDATQPPDGGFGNAEEQAPQPRSFSTTKLVSAATQLRALGWSEMSARAVYRPFPVAGAATFTDTWGALRYGPAPGQIRGHEGQDIFCDRGTPILAVTSGRIQFDTNGLGGRIARLHMRDGSYWYYAHLSRWNKRVLSSGDRVQPGDVIGYCGHSGDAKTTPDHLHLGWYSKKGAAQNPMRLLVGWLRLARADARTLVRTVERRVARRMELQVLGRMFGDSWAPDLSPAAASPQPATGVAPSPSSSASTACDPGVIAPAETAGSTPCVPPNGALVPAESGE